MLESTKSIKPDADVSNDSLKPKLRKPTVKQEQEEDSEDGDYVNLLSEGSAKNDKKEDSTNDELHLLAKEFAS